MIKQPVSLPPGKQWNQLNNGFLFGSSWSTKNITFDVPGIASLSQRTRYLYREATSGANFDHFLAAAYGQFGGTASGFASTDQYIIVTDDELFLLSASLENCGQLTNASTPSGSDYSDGISWNDGFYVSTTSNLSKLVSGTWTGSLMTLTSSVPHPLCASASANYLLVGNNSVLKKRTTGGTNSDALTLPSNYQIVWIRSSYARTLIGARAKDGTFGAVFEWDEVAPTWTNKYDLDCAWPYSGTFRTSDFFIVTNDGRLQKFNGGGFSDVAQWPIYKANTGYWSGNNTNLVSNPVFQRGMDIVGGHLTINVGGGVEQGQYGVEYYDNFSSGVWDFTEETGLTHRWGLTVSSDDTDFSQDYQVGSGAIFPVFVEDTPPDGTVGSKFIAGARMGDGATDYYAIVSAVSDGANVGQLTSTRLETSDVADDFVKIWCKYRGVFESTDLIRFKYKDKWIDGLPFTDLQEGTNGVTWTSTTTFTSTNPLWAAVLAAGSDGGGYEVTIEGGPGAGSIRHISAISLATSTYTVTLDAAVTGVTANDDGTVGVDNFLLLEETITNADTAGYKEIPITQTDPTTWVQAKAELRGTEYVTIEEFQIVPASDVVAQP